MEEKIIDLILKSLWSQPLTNQEKKDLNLWLSNQENSYFYEGIRQFSSEAQKSLKAKEANLSDAIKKHCNHLKNNRKSTRLRFFRRIVACVASILFVVGILYTIHEKDELIAVNEQNSSNKKSSSQKAELILANGKLLQLELGNTNDSIAEKDGTVIKNTKLGLVYNANDKANKMMENHNNLLVPRGGEFQLQLADGTRVWLNSETKLRYPTRFTGNERVVFLEGEAYFEVAKNESQAFIVKTKDVSVRVLGTQFNISSYITENCIKTTLVEGCVEVSDNKNPNVKLQLKPGFQAIYEKTNRQLEDKKVNLNLFTSWKDGKFIFERTSLHDMMNKLSRWYDVEIVYLNNELENIHFTGTLKRYDNLHQLLRMIEKTNEVKFEFKNKIVFVKTPD